MAPTADEIGDALIAGFFRFTVDEQRLIHTIYRLLATGHPAAIGAIVEGAGWSVADVEGRLSSWPAVYRDDEGDVIGFMGLSCEAVSDHRILIPNLGEAWTWCALDPLVFAPLLGTRVEVASRCPVTGIPVSLLVTPDGVTGVDPSEAVVSLLVPARFRFDDDVRQAFCHYVHFLSSTDAARDWTGQHPETFSIAVDDTFEIAGAVRAAVFPAIATSGGETDR